jgi:hypothetical protein
MNNHIVLTSGHAMPHFLASAGGDSAVGEIIITVMILGASIAYLVWLVKRKL